MKKWVAVTLAILVVGMVFLVWRVRSGREGGDLLRPTLGSTERPLEKYSFERLRNRTYSASKITFDHVLTKNAGFASWVFYFQSDGKKVSGAANVPNSLSAGEGQSMSLPAGTLVIVLDRGYADRTQFYPGFGTEHVASVLAGNGYVTLAPDFLGYGTSEAPSKDVFEERFEAYTTVLNLLSSVEGVCSGQCKIGLWGHSNGGQVTLSVLEISGRAIPTVLWNPVSKPFPYSILYYTDDSNDHGKALRRALAYFERDYDVEKYSLTNFLSWITAPTFLQQGGVDTSVPQSWSDALVARLKQQSKSITYKLYPGADHNMTPVWDQAVADDLGFYKKNL